MHLKEWQGVTVNQMVPPITDVIPMWTHCLSESLFPLHSSVDLVNTVFVLFSSFGLVGFKVLIGDCEMVHQLRALAALPE